MSESGFFQDNVLTLGPAQLLVVINLGLAERFLFLKDCEGMWVLAVRKFDAPLKVVQSWYVYGDYYWSPRVGSFVEAVRLALEVNGGDYE